MTAQSTPRPGTWARADGFIGVVARADEHETTLFDPGRRLQRTAATAAITRVPAAAVRVTATIDLPLAHGLDETDLRRWLAMLIDPVLRERAADALVAAGLDIGVTLPHATVTASAHDDGSARCLCGASVPGPAGPGGADLAPCPVCGRQPAPPATPPAT